MPVDTKYNGYDDMLYKVSRVRDFADGEIKVKSMGDKYLPRLSGQSEEDFQAYVQRGYLVPAVEPAALAITGAIMRKPPTFEPQGKLSYLIDDFDGKGNGVEQFVSTMITELNYAGAAGYLIEYGKETKTTAKPYTRENIVNISDNYVVLCQEYTVQSEKDKFEQEAKKEYLELTFDEQGNYIQNLWRETKKGFEMVGEPIMPTMRGQAFDFIPFVICSESNKGLFKSEPILLHMANVNLAQYRRSADQSHGLHWLALPTLFLFGDLRDQEGNRKQISIGAGSANHIEDTDAKAELLEFTGAGMKSIKDDIDDKVATMASIGAKALANGGDGVKSAETARIDASSETATLSIIANAVDEAMSQILAIIAQWENAPVPEFQINRDFIDVKIDPQMLSELRNTWQSGGMSLDTFLNQLLKGEILPSGVTVEDEKAKIEMMGDAFSEEDPNL